jgi:hypothetical protein
MTDTNSTSDVLDFAKGEKPAIPSGLNVLTILTFIGCGIGFLSSIWSYVNAEKGYKDMVDAQSKLTEAPAWAKKMMGPEMVEIARKSLENKLPILLLGLVATALCLYGALEMRKLKKQGFILYVVGELLPIVAGVLFIGTGMFSGFALIGIAIPIIFIILYLMQKKHLIY